MIVLLALISCADKSADGVQALSPTDEFDSEFDLRIDVYPPAQLPDGRLVAALVAQRPAEPQVRRARVGFELQRPPQVGLRRLAVARLDGRAAGEQRQVSPSGR